MINGFPGPGYSLWNNCILHAKVILLFLVNGKRNLQKGIYWLLWLSGGLLFYFAFRNVPFEALKEELSSIRPVYLLLLLIPSWGGQFLRSWRWQLLLGKGRSYKAIYHSLLFGYFVNLALPRVGEISRCAALQKTDGSPFGKNLGTVVVERITDLVFLLLVVLLAFWMQTGELKEWMDLRIRQPLEDLGEKHSGWMLMLLLGLVLLLLLAWFIYRRIKNKLNDKLRILLEQVSEGIQGLLHLGFSRLMLFLLLSAGIWTCYFFTTWFWFQALPSANGASFAMAFTVMVMGSLVKTLPIQGGGAGAYHLVIGELLALYGLGTLSSKTFALLNHGYQTIFYLLFGGFSAFWVGLQKKK